MNGCGRDPRAHQLVLKRLDDLLSIAYARFYAYLYKDLPLCWRQLYTDASILKFSYLYLLSRSQQDDTQGSKATLASHFSSSSSFQAPANTNDNDRMDARLDEMIKTLDLALILAGAGGRTRGRRWIDKAFALLERVQVQCANITPAGGSSDTAIAVASAAAARYDCEETAGDITAGDATAPPPTKKVKLDNNNNYDDHAKPTDIAIGSPSPPPPWAPSQQPSSFSARRPFTPPVRHAIRRVVATDMDMSAFQRYLDAAAAPRNNHEPNHNTDRDRDRGGGGSGGPEPLILTGLVEDWPARGERPWDKPAYLLSQTFGGRRLVPVEVGRSYVDEGWGQKIVRFGDFLREYIDPGLPSSLFSSSSPCPSPPPPSSVVAQQSTSTTITNDHSSQNLSSSSTAVVTTIAAAKTTPPPPPPSSGAQRQAEEDPPNTTTTAAATTITAYLAQHQLFLQLPHLRNDILIPDHCYTSPPPHPDPHDPSRALPELDEPLLNAWLGPPGTITPLHTDPYHNLLVQVVGTKYVRLYAPREGARMRGRGKEGGVDMGNTSMWDVGVLEGWDRVDDGGGDDDNTQGLRDGDGDENGRNGDHKRWQEEEEEEEKKEVEDFRNVPFVDCILEPGDTLYIPVGWWHYVRGLSVSFSVSIWWN